MDLKDLLTESSKHEGKNIEVCGWVRNHRKQKEVGFIDFYDGTCVLPVQITYTSENKNFNNFALIKIGSALEVSGKFQKMQGKESYEIIANDIKVLGNCEDDYPIQPKKHSIEFLREIAYLRPRTRLYQSIFRIRNFAAMAIHEYFQSNNYMYVHTPLISANDAEGAGNTFTVTNFDLNRLNGKVDYSKDFFGKATSLAVTGQLEAETFAMAFKKVYTFGPTFRAENSNTKTHAAEFWMIEPEIAFCDLNGLMDIEEEFLKYVVKYILEKAKPELDFLNTYNKNNGAKVDLVEKLNTLISSKVVRVSHKDAVSILEKVNDRFEFKAKQGEDFAKEHEKYLTEEYFNSPVFVYDWPKDIKAFYMKQNTDNKTVGAVDLLVPLAGELMGGSERETDYSKLIARMNQLHISTEEMWWYTNLRRYGGCTHSGFGMGFERLIIYLTGVDNIRDVIPYPRTPKNCDF